MHRHNISRLQPDKRPQKSKRYNRPVPGDRVQIDNCKIGKYLYQFTAVDDCTRMRVLGLYSTRSSKNAIRFLLDKMLPQFPFPVQRIQSDRGQEFLSMDFQDVLRDRCIKFRPNRPYSPHLNGKVERSQKTDRMEFWSTVNRNAERCVLDTQLSEWQQFYNDERTHSTIGKTPKARLDEVRELIPALETVKAAFDPERESYRTNYRGAPSPG